MNKRSQWVSGLGFLLATAGAAIGLGNLWKFPYLMGRNGGFLFLIVYLIFVVLLGVPMMIVEMGIGRYTQQDAVMSFRKLGKGRAGFIGAMGVLSSFLILSYYSVIAGWILKYIVSYATTFHAPADFAAYTATTWEPIVWHLLFMAITAFVCYKGTQGIEKASKLMMPGLFLLLILVIARSVTLPGAGEGLAFIFTPGESAFSFSAINAALGQVFYSLSLAMGITVTYGSYLSKEQNIPTTCLRVAGLDTLAAVLAGVAIFPAVFALGLAPNQGAGLIFITLPQVFDQIGGGALFAVLFFVLMLFAALTSTIALLETVVAYCVDSLGMNRAKAVALMAILIALLGVPVSLSFGILGDFTILGFNFYEFIGLLTDNLLLPLGALFTCVYVGWIWGPKTLLGEIETAGNTFRWKRAWVFCIRFLTPVLIAVVTIGGLGTILGAILG